MATQQYDRTRAMILVPFICVHLQFGCSSDSLFSTSCFECFLYFFSLSFFPYVFPPLGVIFYILCSLLARCLCLASCE